MAIRRQQDFFSGLMFLAFGVAGMILSRGYQLGTAQRMGPGYFPFAISTILSVLGLIIVAQAILSKNRGGDIEKISFSIITLILGSVVAFAFLLNTLGLIAAVGGVILISSYASDEFRWKTAAVSAAVLALVDVVVFVWGLGLALPLLPAFIQG